MALRLILLLVGLFFATTARADDWAVLWWSPSFLVAVDAGEARRLAEGTTAARLTKIVRWESGEIEARVSEQEVDCRRNRVRQLWLETSFDGRPMPRDPRLGAWRDTSSEPDRYLLQHVCRSGPSRLPQVQGASLAEAIAAHRAINEDADQIAREPSLRKWILAFQEYLPTGPLIARVPSLHIAMQSGHEFLVAESRPQAVILVSRDITKVSDERWRWHQLEVGVQRNPSVVAVWTLQEVDCKASAARMLAAASFDRQAKIVAAQEQAMWDPPFQPLPDRTPYRHFVEGLCKSPRSVALASGVELDLRQAVAALEDTRSPDLLVRLGFGTETLEGNLPSKPCRGAGCLVSAVADFVFDHLMTHLVFAALVGATGYVGRAFWRRRGVWRPHLGYAIVALFLGSLAVLLAVTAWLSDQDSRMGFVVATAATLIPTLLLLPYGFVLSLWLEPGGGFGYRDATGRTRRLRWGEVERLEWAGGVRVVTHREQFALSHRIQGLEEFLLAARAAGARFDPTLADLLDDAMAEHSAQPGVSPRWT